ncbi:nuclear transport factor 2 family protein [Actinoplanes rectilineatus]|uniref:nuclear transport factor 2 family protein n=1 Tax=Actinoplanes rectilineatus TaxID=113571 RepID=UPI000696108F|nr:nuclear transport factor 2 family protein [Actinoplanes rectilineatus]
MSELASRLVRVLDEKRYDAMASVFTEDAVVATPTGEARGLAALVEKAQTNRPDGVMTQSFLTNQLVTVDGATATIDANLLVVFIREGGSSNLFGERYHLTAVRTAHGWRISRVGGTPLWEAPVPDLKRLVP